jgi:hypothetical protein
MGIEVGQKKLGQGSLRDLITVHRLFHRGLTGICPRQSGGAPDDANVLGAPLFTGTHRL